MPFPKHLLGPAKSDITLAEMQAHPIWLWGFQVNDPDDADGVMGGNETGMRPWLGTSNVTRKMAHPKILLRVKGTNLWAAGLYDAKLKSLDSIGVFGEDGLRKADWYINSPGVPITYIAVPSIEGRDNVQFVAKNRRRWGALMVGAFTPSQAEQRYDEEMSNDTGYAGSPTDLLRKDPELIKMIAAFLQRSARDNVADRNGIVFFGISGGIEDEDPALFNQLIKEANGKGFSFRDTGQAIEKQGKTLDSKTGEQGILIHVMRCRTTGNAYDVEGWWSGTSDQVYRLSHRISKADGTWSVRD